MEDLLQFLRYRLDEDQAAALAADGDAIEATPSLWDTKYLTLRGNHEDRHTTELPGGLADHIARNDPMRVLRDIEARRALLNRFEELAIVGKEQGHVLGGDVGEEYLYVVLPTLALPYADHPDYRAEWRP
jgi:hypothetical protein